MKKFNSITFLSVITVLLGIVYIAETSNVSIQGYVISESQKQRDEYQQSLIELNTEVAQYNAIGNVRQNPTVATMESSTFIHLDENGALVRR